MSCISKVVVLSLLAAAGASAPWYQRYSGNNIAGCCPPGANSSASSAGKPLVVFAGTFTTQGGCEAACSADALCQSYTWQDSHPYGDQTYAEMCYLRYDSYWDIVTYPGHDGHFSGRKCAPLGAAPAYYNASWCSVTQPPTPQWFSRAKFGIYAHWGPYSVPAFSTEWYSRNMYVNSSTVNKHHIQTWGEGFGYKDFVPLFTADKFNASAWAELYRRAGARYAGPVAEHADGFAMYDSALSNFTAVKMGPRRDVTGELTAAMRSEGLKVVTTLHHQWLWGWYPTWDEHTDCGDPSFELTAQQGGLYGPKTPGASAFSPPFNTSVRFQQYWRDKAEEVARLYQPDLIYFDSRLKALLADEYRLDFLAYYYNEAEQWQQQGRSTGVVVTYKDTDLEVGAGTLDYERGGVGDILDKPWQTDDSMDRGSWSWVDPPNLKNATELLGELVDIVSKNGNFLLDIPPHADGSIDPIVQSTLLQMGQWLAVNGQAIFSTSPWKWYGEGPTKIVPGSFHEWPIFTEHDFRFTRAGAALFAVAMAWPADDTFVITTLNSTAPDAKRITDVALLGAGSAAPPLKWHVNISGLHIGPVPRPAALRYAPSTFRLHLDGSAIAVLLWHVHGGYRTGGAATELRWSSGGEPGAAVVIEYQIVLGRGGSGSGAWSEIATVPNSGQHAWHVPGSLAGRRLHVRVRAKDDPAVQDVMELAPMHGHMR